MNINGLTFNQTCYACPEQYDVFDSNGNQVGYVRLRYGSLTCTYPDVGDEEIYYENIGDGWTGCFTSEEERTYHLNVIAYKIHERMNKPDKADKCEDISDEPWHFKCSECGCVVKDVRVIDYGYIDGCIDFCPSCGLPVFFKW